MRGRGGADRLVRPGNAGGAKRPHGQPQTAANHEWEEPVSAKPFSKAGSLA
jgi:hypothetical protein